MRLRHKRKRIWYLRAALCGLFILALPERAWDALGTKYVRTPARPSRAVEIFDGRGV